MKKHTGVIPPSPGVKLIQLLTMTCAMCHCQFMYLDFFHLAEEPFRMTADPRFLWYSEKHKEVKAKTLYHIQARKGPVYVFADVGTGKTSIARRIQEELRDDQKKKIVFAFAPILKTANAFLRFVMDQFEVKTDRNYAKSLEQFEHFLIEQYRAGISPVLLIDEAQNLTADMLKLIHHLFNFTTQTDFLIQMALFGQNELHDRISRNDSLKSRMTPSWLSPLDLDETQQMIAFRWRTAGGQQVPFDIPAMAEIFRVTGGNPRSIVKLCDATLVKAVVDQRQQIDADTVLAAAASAFVLDEQS